MAFDKKHYGEVKKFMEFELNKVDFRLVEKYKDKPFDWAHTFLPLISDCVQRENYEGAKAISDAIREFLNKFLPDGEKITADMTLKLPKFKTVKIKGIICYIDKAQII